jgi:hypothetical protein
MWTVVRGMEAQTSMSATPDFGSQPTVHEISMGLKKCSIDASHTDEFVNSDVIKKIDGTDSCIM